MSDPERKRLRRERLERERLEREAELARAGKKTAQGYPPATWGTRPLKRDRKAEAANATATEPHVPLSSRPLDVALRRIVEERQAAHRDRAA